MENNQNAKLGSKPNTNANNGEHVENPNSDCPDEDPLDSVAGSLDMGAQSSPTAESARPSSRTPFTNLSQVDADLALARTLQEQFEAELVLSARKCTILCSEDNNLSVEFDPAVYSSDEAYARALQDAEEREMAARLLALAGISDQEDDDSEPEENGGNSQDAWEEELLALGEVVGTESRGLSADGIASLPSVNYKTGSSQNGSNDSCVICRLDYEDVAVNSNACDSPCI
ncbi:hypothetical protein TIFTF001_021697 [Ficus carica]|uniref:Uncharacterized protein n=1 Tax=Ficus carica TaxID=3494 RepID=A0AA88ASV5_FICCA|nr:hypothetical protein TIFTF001_021697 [Ficus carica]